MGEKAAGKKRITRLRPRKLERRVGLPSSSSSSKSGATSPTWSMRPPYGRCFSSFGPDRKWVSRSRRALAAFPVSVRRLTRGFRNRWPSRNLVAGGYEHAFGCESAVAGRVRRGADRGRGGQVHESSGRLGQVPEPGGRAPAARRRADVHEARRAGRDRRGADGAPAPAIGWRSHVGLAGADHRKPDLDGQRPGHRGARCAAGHGRGGAGDDAGPSEDEGTRTDAGPADADGPDRDDPPLRTLAPARYTLEATPELLTPPAAAGGSGPLHLNACLARSIGS